MQYSRDTRYDVRLSPECSALGYRTIGGTIFRILSNPSAPGIDPEVTFSDGVQIVEPFDLIDERQGELPLH